MKIPYADVQKRFQVEKDSLLYSFNPKIPQRPTRLQEHECVSEAIKNPIGSEKIEDQVGAGDRVALLVDDWTRSTPASKIVPIVLERFLNNGIKAKDIKVIIARGTHSPLTRQQMTKKLGTKVASKYHVENHNPAGNLAFLGESRKGTPIYLNKSFIEADFKVGVGGIVAHPIAGYGGGAKIIVPGVAGVETINHNHSRAESQKVAIGVVDGNPVREDMEDIARIAGLDFIVNVVLNPQKEVICAVAGDVVKAHREGIKHYNRFYGMRIGELADMVVLGAHPRDATIYHGTFALPCSVPVTKSSGTIVWVAPCISGPGTKFERLAFRETLAVPPVRLMKAIKAGDIPASGGVFDWSTSKVLHRNKVILVSDMINRMEAEEFGFQYAESIQEAVDQELILNEDVKVGVVSVGGLAVPIHEDRSLS